MKKKKLIAIVSGTILSLGLFAGCSAKTEVNVNSNNDSINSNQGNVNKPSVEQDASKGELTITDIKVDESIFEGEDLSIDIEGIKAEYIAYIGNYGVWVPEDESFLYMAHTNSKGVVQKVSLSGNTYKPKGDKVLGADNYSSFYCYPSEGEIFYVNSSSKLMVMNLNGDKPEIKPVDVDFSVNYIAGAFVSVDETHKNELYVVSADGELYRIDYVDAEQDGSGVYKVDGYDNVKFSDILKGKDSSKTSIRLEWDYASDITLVIRELDGENKVESTVIGLEYDEHYENVSLSLK